MFNRERKCSGLSLDQYTKGQLREMALIEVAYAHIKEQKQTISFKELIDVLTETLGLSKQEVNNKISQFYTDLNIDGRFLCLGENRWGLRSWYPVDQVEEEIVTVIKPKKKKKKKKVEEEFDDYDELEEDEYIEEDAIEDDEDDDEDVVEDEDDEEEFDDFDEIDDDELIEEDEFEVDEEFDEEDELDEEEEK